MIKRKSCTTGKVGNQNSSGAACYFLEATEESLNSVMIFVGYKSVVRLHSLHSVLLQQPTWCSVMPPRLLLGSVNLVSLNIDTIKQGHLKSGIQSNFQY